MSAVELLRQAIRQVCEESGKPWPEGVDEEFSDPLVARVADLFAELVIAGQRPHVVHVPSDDTEGGGL